jgi:hypothetical protein
MAEDPLRQDRVVVERDGGILRVRATGDAGPGRTLAEGRPGPQAGGQPALLRHTARRPAELGTRWDVLDGAGARIGVLERRSKQSMLRERWGLLDGTEGHEVAWAVEEGGPLPPLARRLGVRRRRPPARVRLRVGQREAGEIRGEADAVVVDLAEDPRRAVDRRLTVALGAALLLLGGGD